MHWQSSGALELVQALLELQPQLAQQLQQTDDQGRAPIELAVEASQWPLVQFLAPFSSEQVAAAVAQAALLSAPPEVALRYSSELALLVHVRLKQYLFTKLN